MERWMERVRFFMVMVRLRDSLLMYSEFKRLCVIKWFVSNQTILSDLAVETVDMFVDALSRKIFREERSIITPQWQNTCAIHQQVPSRMPDPWKGWMKKPKFKQSEYVKSSLPISAESSIKSRIRTVWVITLWDIV